MNRFISLLVATLCLVAIPSAAQNKNSGSNNYKFYKVEELIDQGNYAEAYKLASENVQENPEFIDAYIMMVSLDIYNANYAPALKIVNQALENNHKNSGFSNEVLLWWKSTVYYNLGDIQQAINILEPVVKKFRKQKSQYLFRVLKDLGRYKYLLEDYDEAEKIYKEMQVIDESDMHTKVAIAKIEHKRKNYDNALAILDNCINYNSDYYEIYRTRTSIYHDLGEYKKMIDDMFKLYEITNEPDYLVFNWMAKEKKYAIAKIKQKIASSQDNLVWKMALVNLYEECYMYSDIIPLYNEMIAEYANDPYLYYLRSLCFDDLGMSEYALNDINKSIEIETNEEDKYTSYWYKTAYLADLNRYDEAFELANEYIEKYPAEYQGYFTLGFLYMETGKSDLALEAIENAMMFAEDEPAIRIQACYIQIEQGNKDAALESLERIIEIDTVANDNSVRHYALHHLGRTDEAIEWIDKVIEEDPDNFGCWYDKTCLLSIAGKYDEAVQALETALKKGYRGLSHMEKDVDLNPIRDREDYKALINQYKEILETEKAKFAEVENVNSSESIVSEVNLKKNYGGTYEVACEVNGLPLNMIFDTGASDVTISSVEASFMLKNGYLSTSDIKGKNYYKIASGEIQEGTVIKLKEVKIGDAVLTNIEASVVHNQQAPLLLGQSVLERFGTITIDNVNSKLIIRQ